MKIRLNLLTMLLCLSSSFVTAQTPAPLAPFSESEITISVQRQQVRFASASKTREWRLEIHDPSGSLIHDSGNLLGSEVGWSLSGLDGQAVASGLYAYKLTLKEPQQEAAQVQTGHIIVDRMAEQSSDRLWIVGRGVAGVEVAVSETDNLSEPGARTIESGRDSRGRTAETEITEASSANAQGVTGKGTPNQLVRMNDAAIRTIAVRDPMKRSAEGRGIELNTSAIPAGQVPFATGNRLTPSNPATPSQTVTGAGTPSQAAKWAASSIIGDSIITDTGTNVGIGTTTPGSKLTVAGAIDATTQYNLSGARVLSVAGVKNVFVGVDAGVANSTGTENSFFGKEAGFSNTTGAGNTFFGSQAGRANVSGNANAFFGQSAGLKNTASGNAFFGNGAGFNNTTGPGNAFFGESAGFSNTSGKDNAYFGKEAGLLNTQGQDNAFFGSSAGRANIGGSANAFFGSSAGLRNLGSENSFFGAGAGYSNTGGDGNAFFGRLTGYSNTTGTANVFFGKEAGFANTTGKDNAFFGANAGRANVSGNANAFFGQSAGLKNIASGNAFFGSGAGFNNTTGPGNAFFGESAGFSNTTGAANAFFGKEAGLLNTTGKDNAFFGSSAGRSNTTGVSNSFFGAFAGTATNIGSYNSFFGVGAGNHNTNGDSNTLVGEGAGSQNTTGAENSFFGRNAGVSNTFSHRNSFFGTGAGYSSKEGRNTFIGYNAGFDNVNGSGNTYIGYDARGVSNLQRATANGAVARMNDLMRDYRRGYRFAITEIRDIGGTNQPTGPSRWYNTDFFAENGSTLKDQMEAAAMANAVYLWCNNAINIYVTNGICGGICSFPGSNDDIIIMGGCVDSDEATQLHEIGHYFNLCHTQGCECGCADTSRTGECNRTPGDDGIADTLPDLSSWNRDQIAQHSFSRNYDQLNAAQKNQVDDVFLNIMSYHDSACGQGVTISRLTEQQLDRWSQSANIDRVGVRTGRMIFAQAGAASGGNGSPANPYNTVNAAAGAAATDTAADVIVLRPGSFNTAITINTPVTLRTTRQGATIIGSPVPPSQVEGYVNLQQYIGEEKKSSVRPHLGFAGSGNKKQ